MRGKGDIEDFDLGEITGIKDLNGIVAGVAHVGPGVLKRWNIRARHFQVRELKRLKEARENETPKTAPHLWPEDPSKEDVFIVATEEGQLEFIKLEAKCLEECMAYLKGRKGMENETDPKELAAEVERLGAAERLAVKAMEVQRLSRESFSAPEGPGDVPAEPASDADK